MSATANNLISEAEREVAALRKLVQSLARIVANEAQALARAAEQDGPDQDDPSAVVARAHELVVAREQLRMCVEHLGRLRALAVDKQV